MVLKFSEKEPPLTKDPRSLLKTFPFKLPESYLNMLKESDGGYLDYDFDYYNKSLKRNFGSGISVLYGLKSEYNLIDEFSSPAEMFPKGIVAFGEDGGGDKVCFDYRKNPDSDNPPIVYWSHEGDVGEDLSYLAKDFEEFLSILKEPEEVED